MHKILVVVDVQQDFVTGSLGTAEAQAMLPALLQKLEHYEGEVVFTRDTHQSDYLTTQEGRLLPVEHCLEHTAGWELVPALQSWSQEHHSRIFDKPTFGSTTLAQTLKAEYEAGHLTEVELVGLCTDICVVSNALLLKAAMPELTVRVDASCCAGVTPAKHAAALEVMRSCQILVA